MHTKNNIFTTNNSFIDHKLHLNYFSSYKTIFSVIYFLKLDVYNVRRQIMSKIPGTVHRKIYSMT